MGGKTEGGGSPRGKKLLASQSGVPQGSVSVLSVVPSGSGNLCTADAASQEEEEAEVSSSLTSIQGALGDTEPEDNQRSRESLLRAFVGLESAGRDGQASVSSKLMLHRLYSLLPWQLTASYRPNAVVAPDATADNNIRLLKEMRQPDDLVLPPMSRQRGKVCSSGMKK